LKSRLPLTALAGLLLLGSPAFAKARPGERGNRAALSVGSPTCGRLEGGIELVGREGLKLKRPTTARWGLPQLVSLLERGARRVRGRHPGSVLLIGDLSRRGGGDIAAHRSHESGRDADVGFYFVDRRGKAVQLSRFRAVDTEGRVVGERQLMFDLARNWMLIQAWLTDPHVRVQHIFVAAPLRQRLLRYARERGVSPPLLHRASLALKQPRDGLLHDDHFHVRIACPPRQNGVCVAEPIAEARRSSKAKNPRKRDRKASLPGSKRRAFVPGTESRSKRLLAGVR
jgi:penicillin-insensitive murein DD-endopeptidase